MIFFAYKEPILNVKLLEANLFSCGKVTGSNSLDFKALANNNINKVVPIGSNMVKLTEETFAFCRIGNGRILNCFLSKNRYHKH